MHMLRGFIVFGSLLIGSIRSAVVPTPVVTPAPNFPTQWLEKSPPIDPIEFAQLLLTAIPLSLRQIAATNLPAVSSILWEEFLDDKKPQWFQELPWDVQSYLIVEFGSQTAWPTAPPTSDGWSGEATVTKTDTILLATTITHVVSASRSETSVATVSTPASSSGDSFASASTPSSPSNTLATSSSGSQSSTSSPNAPPASTFGLSRNQKIALGVGIPLGVLGATALIFGCCFLLRRHRRKIAVDGDEPPSTPGFIPRFAFHETASVEHLDHRAPLNPVVEQSSYENERMIWEDDDVDTAPINHVNTFAPTTAIQDSNPIMTPGLYHTHSSNRARGRRTSYTSLHSVAEVTEPDEEAIVEQQASLRSNPRRSLTLVMPPIPAAATLKRKPIPTSPTEYPPYHAAAEATSQPFLRPLTINSWGSSNGAMSSQHTSFSSEPSYQPDVMSGAMSSHHTSFSSEPSYPPEVSSGAMSIQHAIFSPELAYHLDTSSAPMSPLSLQNNGYSYIEDYEPEWQNRYVDAQDGLYGGHRSLDTYPEPTPRRNSRTEWPLRSVVGSRREKNTSPIWDRLYEKRRYHTKQ